MQDRWALVTGAAHGIGRATAELLARRGAWLVLCDIDEAALNEVGRRLTGSGAKVLTYQVDVADLSAMTKLARWVEARAIALDLLVNNAGVLEIGGLDETSEHAWQHVMGVNLWGVVHACRLLVPAMRHRKRGQVVNVASAAGEVAFAPLLAYTTTKFAVVGFSRALRAELRPHGVGVSVVCPGLVDSSIVDHPRFDAGTRTRLGALLRRHGLPPERVARAILKAAQRDIELLPVGAEARALHWSARLFPSAASQWLHRIARARSSSPSAR